MLLLLVSLLVLVLACAGWSSRRLRRQGFAWASVVALACLALLLGSSLAALSHSAGRFLASSGTVANTASLLFAVLAPIAATHLASQAALKRGLRPQISMALGAIIGVLVLASAPPAAVVLTCALSGECA